MNQTKIFAILIGTLLGVLPVRGQENVENSEPSNDGELDPDAD